MKQIILATALALAVGHAFAQTADSGSTANSTSGALAGSTAIGGGAVSATIGGSTNTTRNANTARGGNGGNGQGGAASSNVTVNLGSAADPSASDPTSRSATPVANAQQAAGQQPSGTYKERIETVGNPGAMSYGVSFSQYNCANTAGLGVGFMGGSVSLGAGHESAPCNARANAAALYSLAQSLATANPAYSAQLMRAAVLLIGNSTSETQEALRAAGVSDWAPVATVPAPAIVPTPAPTVPDESRTTSPNVAAASVPLPAIKATPLTVEPAAAPDVPASAPVATAPDDSTVSIEQVKATMFAKAAPLK